MARVSFGERYITIDDRELGDGEVEIGDWGLGICVAWVCTFLACRCEGVLPEATSLFGPGDCFDGRVAACGDVEDRVGEGQVRGHGLGGFH